MADLLNPDAKAGHNAPPDPLLVAVDAQINTIGRWTGLHSDLERWDESVAAQCAGLIADVTKAWTAFDNQRLAEGREFKATQDAKYAGPLSLADTAKKALMRLRTGWLQREEARQRAEQQRKLDEAKRLAELAAKVAEKAGKSRDPLRAQMEAQEAEQRAREAQAAAEAAPVKAQIRGAGVRTVGLKTTWDAEIVDPKLAFRHYKGHPLMLLRIQDTLLELARKDATSTKDEKLAPAGVRFFSTRQ